VAMPYSEEHQVHEQDLGFTTRQPWDFEASLKKNGFPLLLHAPYFQIYRKQVIKQADLILAMHWCGDAFTPEEKARAFAYYEPLTVRDSSLSACTQAIVAAEVGQLDLAADYLAEAAMMDLRDLEHNTKDGLHIASLAGAWLAVVAGFGGMRDHGGQLSFRPQLPLGWTRLCFRVVWRDTRIKVTAEGDQVTFEAAFEGEDPPAEGITVRHVDRDIVLRHREPVTVAMSYVEPLTERPKQPTGREPIRADSLDSG
jgi:alpha,alpha-trehalose phosphorylase